MGAWTKRVALAGLVGGFALTAGGCRLEETTFGVDAQPARYDDSPDQSPAQAGTGGAGQEGQPAAMTTEHRAPGTPEGAQHGLGLGNVIDGQGYERQRRDSPAMSAEQGPLDTSLRPRQWR